MAARSVCWIGGRSNSYHILFKQREWGNTKTQPLHSRLNEEGKQAGKVKSQEHIILCPSEWTEWIETGQGK